MKYRKHGIFLMVFMVVVLLCSVMIFNNKEEKEEKGEEVIAYVLHDDVLIEYPFITYMNTREDMIKEIIGFMKQSHMDCEAILYENTILDDVEIKDDIVYLSFSMMDYNLMYERKLLESMIYTCTQFEGLNRIILRLNGEELEYMPKDGLPLTNTDRSFGMNAIDTNQYYLHEGNSALVYYTKKIQDKIFYVPRSVRLKRKDDYLEIINVLLKNTNASLSLIQPFASYHIISNKEPYYENHTLHLYFNKNILKDNNTLYEDCEMILKKTFQMNEITNVEVHVNDKTFTINIRNS